jgi:AcrR family transcriptional regulator
MSDASEAIAMPPAAGGGKLERTRQRLVQAVREEICDTGNFTADLVARRSGTSAATFYNHFASKDDALIAAYDSLMADLVALVADVCRIERLLDLGLRKFLAEWLARAVSFFREHSGLFRLAQAATTTSRDMREVFRRHEAAALVHYERFIQLGQSANLIRHGDRAAMARVLLVISESWNHPLMRSAAAGSALQNEWTEALVRVLAMEEA